MQQDIPIEESLFSNQEDPSEDKTKYSFDQDSEQTFVSGSNHLFSQNSFSLFLGHRHFQQEVLQPQPKLIAPPVAQPRNLPQIPQGYSLSISSGGSVSSSHQQSISHNFGGEKHGNQSKPGLPIIEERKSDSGKNSSSSSSSKDHSKSKEREDDDDDDDKQQQQLKKQADKHLSISKDPIYRSKDNAVQVEEEGSNDSDNFIFSQLPSYSDIKSQSATYIQNLKKKTNIDLSKLIKLEVLGQGAFGRVYRAFDPIHNRFYALKELEESNFKSKAVFAKVSQQEISNLLYIASIGNKNLLQVQWIDLDEQKGLCRILLELGKGTLQEYAEFRKIYGLEWTESEIEVILFQLLKQVEALKKAGIFHRDIKPANIIFSELQGKFKLTDYGCSVHEKSGIISKSIQNEHKNNLMMSMNNDLQQQILTGQSIKDATSLMGQPLKIYNVCGTPFYMSPELKFLFQVKKAHTGEYDPYLSDLYSIGMTILKMVEPTINNNNAQLFLHGQFHKKYPNAHMHIASLISNETQERYVQSLGFLRLHYWQKNTSIMEGWSSPSKEGKKSKENIFLIKKYFVLGKDEEIKYKSFLFRKIFKKNSQLDYDLYLRMFMYDEAEFQLKQQIEIKNKKRETDSSKIQEISLRIIKLKLVLAKCYFFSEKHSEQFNLLQDLANNEESHYANDQLIKASIKAQFGKFYHKFGDIDKAIKAFKESFDIRQQQLGQYHPLVAELCSMLGLCYMAKNQSKKAMEMFEHHLEINSRSDEGDIEDSILNPTLFMSYPMDSKKLQEYLDNFDSIEKRFDKESDRVTIFFYRGLIQMALKDFKEAEKSFSNAIGLIKLHYGEESPQVAKIYLSLAFYCRFRVEIMERGEIYLTKALAICKKWFGDEDINTAYVYLSLGHYFYELDHVLISIENYERGIPILESRPDSNLRRLKLLYHLVSKLYFRIENTNKGLQYINKLIQACAKPDSDPSTDLTNCLHEIAKGTIALHDTKDYAKAEDHALRAQAISKDKKTSEMIPIQADCLLLLAQITEKAGNMKKALKLYEEHYQFCSTYKLTIETSQSLTFLCFYLMKKGQIKKAIEHLDRAIFKVDENLSPNNGFSSVCYLLKGIASFYDSDSMETLMHIAKHLDRSKMLYGEKNKYAVMSEQIVNQAVWEFGKNKQELPELKKQNSK